MNRRCLVALWENWGLPCAKPTRQKVKSTRQIFCRVPAHGNPLHGKIWHGKLHLPCALTKTHGKCFAVCQNTPTRQNKVALPAGTIDGRRRLSVRRALAVCRAPFRNAHGKYSPLCRVPWHIAHGKYFAVCLLLSHSKGQSPKFPPVPRATRF